jgi:hypothetical protein
MPAPMGTLTRCSSFSFSSTDPSLTAVVSFVWLKPPYASASSPRTHTTTPTMRMEVPPSGHRTAVR